MRLRGACLLALTAAFALGIAPLAAGQSPNVPSPAAQPTARNSEPGIKVTVEPRWGLASAGQWTPYVVTVENTTADFSGELVLIPDTDDSRTTLVHQPKVDPSSRPGNSASRGADPRRQSSTPGKRDPEPLEQVSAAEVSPSKYPVYKRQVSVAGRGGRQQFAAVVLEPKFGYRAELRDSAGKRVAKARRPKHSGAATVAVFTASKQVGAVMDMVEAQFDEVAFTRWDSPRDLPSNAVGLSGLSIMIIEDFETAALTKHQIQALKTWIAFGGTLVLGGSESATRVIAGLPEEIAPLKPTETKEGPLATFAGNVVRRPNAPIPDHDVYRAEADLPVPIVIGPIRHGNASVRTTKGDALIVESPYGSGRITQLTFGLFSDELGARMTLAPTVWREVFRRTQPIKDFTPQLVGPVEALDDTQVWQSLLDRPPWPLPGKRGVVFLSGYVLLLGPVSYLISRATKRRELAWLTVPVLSLGGILLLSFSANSIQKRATENVVEIQTATQGGAIRFETFRGRYTLEKVTGLKLPPESAASTVPITKSTQTRLRSGSNDWSTISNLPSAVEVSIGGQTPWQIHTAQSVRFNSTSSRGLEVALKLSGFDVDRKAGPKGPPRLTGTITNVSSKPIYDLLAQFAGRQAKLTGTLAPDATLKVDLPIEALEYLRSASSLEDALTYETAIRAGAARDVVLVGRLNEAPSIASDGSLDARLFVQKVSGAL